MPSGRKGRGSRHRKQKLEELLDYDEDSNLSHGPDPTPSPWTMEPLPPHVEGPPVLKQDAESVESLPRGINRKEASLKALRVQLPPPSKRKKGATPRMASDTDVANSATATSLDRWDGGDLQVDETLPYFYPSRGELEVASYELKNSNDKVEVLANGTGSKDSKSDGNMKMRKWKSRPEVAAGNRSSTVIDAFGPRQQVESSPSNSNMHTKHNATHQKGLSELECNETTPSVDMNAAKGLKLGSSALERVESNFPIGGSSKRVEKENGAAAQLSHTFETDAFKDEPEWKRGKANDLGLSSSPKLHISRPKRSEGSQMSQRFGDFVQIVSRDDAEVLEKPQHAAGKGTDWALQEDNRNPELEKELENRIRRRREESREESGEKEKWREYEKEKSIRRHLHQKEERYKEESRRREEKNQEEKTKEDGGKAEKGRIDSRQKDEKYKENRYMESKLKEEKQKTDRNRQLPCRDDKECKENRKVDKDNEQRRIDGRLRGDRHKVEKEKDNIQKEDRDAKQKEDSFRDGRCRVDKDKEQKLKDEKVRHYRNKEQRLRDDHFERHKEENSWNARFQDEKEKQVRPRDKVDRAKDRDKEERLETIKEGKVRDERGKNPIKEDLKDEKGSHGKKKGEGEQEDINRTDKLQDKRQKIDKQQDGRDKDEREKVASRHRDDREGESRQREAISKEEKLQHYKDGDESQGVDHRQRSKGEKVAMDRLVDLREKADREKGDGERPVDVNGSGDKEAKQAEVHGKSREVLDGRKEDDKQDDGWWTKDIGHFDMDRDFCLSQDELGIIQSKDLPDQLRVRKAREREARGDRKVVEKLTVQEGDRRGTKASKDDTQDRERAFSVVASSDAMVAHKSEHRLKRTRDAGTVDSAITEKSHERSRGKHFEVENDLPLDDYKVLHCNHEDRLSPYDAPPRSPSPSLPDGNLPPSSEKPERRSKFEMSISVSSSSGTQWARERIRHVIEQTDRIKQHHDLEEEVKSWDPRGTNQDSDDGRGWSLSPNKNWDAFSSLPPDSGKKEYQRGLMRGQEDGYASEREHHRFLRSGRPSKTRRVDGGPRERKEWRLQGSQMKRAPMGGAMVRPQVQARLLPPPPPFRPGIDNPAVIGARGSNYDEGPGSRESGRYDRKLGGAFKRSEMGGPGEMWKGVGVSMGIENWNVQNPGLGPGNMFSPFAHIGGHPSAGFLGMAQHFPVPPLYGSGSAPSSDMGFGGGARYHAGDAGVRFPLPHGPYHGPVMGWQRLAEPNENRLPLVDTWEGHGHYIDERHRFGYLEWDQGGKGMTGGDPWQGQAGDASTGLNPPCFQRDASCQGNIPVEASTFYKDNDQKIEDPLQEIPDTTDPQTASPADPAHVMMREVPQVESKATVQSKARLTRILLNLDVSAKLASNDLYKQYLSLLPASEVKIREMLVLKQGDAHGPIEEDLEFEVDSEAQELLSTPGLYADLLPQLSNIAFEEAVAIYHRPIQHTSVQKSVFGSFILPVDSSLIKMPSLGADFGTVRVGQLEAFGDQSCSSNGFGGPLSARKESLIRASRLVADTLQDGTQDNQGSSPMRDEFSMGQGVEINPRSKQEGVAEVSFKQGGYGGTLGDEEMAVNVDMVAYQMPSAGVVNCNIGLDIPVAEANVELSAIAEMQAREDGNARQMEVVRLDCKGGEWPTGRDDSILVEHCSEAFKEGWRKQHNEAAKEREDGVGSASQSSVSNARPEWQIVLEPEFKIDEVKINSRPQQSSENAYENTH